MTFERVFLHILNGIWLNIIYIDLVIDTIPSILMD